MLYRLKQAANTFLRQQGYRLERIVDYRPHGLRALELAVGTLDVRDPEFFFIQVGAHDGRRGDPVHRFVTRYRWRGLLLEPQPDVFTALTRNYEGEPQLILENAALAEHDGTLRLYTADGRSLRATTNRAALEQHVGRSASIREVTVPAVTFQTLRARHAITRVDLLVVDTEGFDYEVIRLALAAGIRPRLVGYEHLHLTTPHRDACAALLGQHGYRLLRDGGDTIALAGAAGDP
jgi:FkbM family methyltransferase